jgi:hypothetical protein
MRFKTSSHFLCRTNVTKLAELEDMFSIVNQLMACHCIDDEGLSD